MPAAAPASFVATLPVVAAFCGSACLFLVELFAGKLLLPRFGGAPGVWISCLAFFQLVLVAAYFHAHRLIRSAGPGWQFAIQAAVFATAAAAAPLGMAAVVSAPPAGRLPLAVAVLVALAVSVGPVFFALATLAPLLAHWRSLGNAARPDVYGLYAAGNAGSFAALIGYPLVIEPALGLAGQATLAAVLFATAALLAGGCGLAAARSAGRGFAARSGADPPAVPWSQWLRWAAIAALPASWLASVTTYATVEVAPIPLLWVVPLAVYLASFVVVFASGGRRLRAWEPGGLAVAVALVAWLLAGDVTEPTTLVIGLHLAAFGVVCIALHGMLVDDRPDVGRLSSFYLALAAGGACGGLWNALAAPLLFDAHHEFPLAVAAVAALVPASRRFAAAPLRWWPVGAGAAVLGTAVALAPLVPVSRPGWLALVAAAVVISIFCLRGWERSVALVALLLWTFTLSEAGGGVVHRTRTFFGVLRLTEEGNGPSRKLLHGSIQHGVQLISDDPDRRRIPLSYYHEAGPLGSIFQGFQSHRPVECVGVAGLGVGTIAAYAGLGQQFRFFEIDPAVVRIARDERWFTYLADCRGDVSIVVDDARLALMREPDGGLDILVIDAFTGDSVPTHLLTREALKLYGRKLKADGVVALHISNKYLDFAPVVDAVAADGGWMALEAHDYDVPSDYARVASHWMALSRSLDVIGAIYRQPTSQRWDWKPRAGDLGGRPWTDDHTAIGEALRNHPDPVTSPR
jgi:hypothetical protein